MKRSAKMILSLASAVIAAMTYSLFQLNRCSVNSDVALEQYRSNRPALPTKFINNDNQKAIASALVNFWLTGFTTGYADGGIKLIEYEVHAIDVEQWKDDRFLATASVSVRPMRCSYDKWLTGSGEPSGDWVRNKSLSFTIVKDGDSFKVDSVGLGH
jgi:hypothetical protein